ncbi:MAG: DUF4905 domain-containing protein [Cytophagia bacterium]|nr:DUF4905 domain-containing protein [Cytophagia bacterium]
MFKLRRKPVPTVLKSKFSHLFDAPIWETKSASHLILVNTRDNEKLESKFALIDLQSYELMWEGLQFEDEWWVSAYHMTNEMVVFQKFEDSQNIDDRSVFGFDLTAQESVWAMENVKLTGARANQLYLQDEDEGKLIFNIEAKDWDEKLEQVVDESEAFYPVHYEADNEHFSTVARFLKLKAEIEVKGSCDYLESHGLIFIAANHVVDEKKSLTLCVFNETGELLLMNELENNVKGLVSGAFFIVKDALIFVTGKNELKIYSIDEKD